MITFTVHFFVLSQEGLDHLRYCVGAENDETLRSRGQTITIVDYGITGFATAGFEVPVTVSFEGARGTCHHIGDHLEPIIRVFRMLTDPDLKIETVDGRKGAVHGFFVPRYTERVISERKVWFE